MATHFRTCHLCEAMCGVVVEHDDGRILSIRGDHDDRFSRGHICPKALGLKDIHEDPDRLRTPRIRMPGGAFRTASWNEALDVAAQGIRAVQSKYGRNAVATYQGNPTVHNYGSLLYGQLFFESLRSKSRFSATSVDQLPHMFASLLMFGHQLLLPIPDIERTKSMVILGANPLASNGSLMSAPDIKRRLEAIVERGGHITLIDPRRTETSRIASQHVFIRPGSDAFLLFALVYTLFEEGLVHLGRLDSFTDGVETVRLLAQPFSPERVAGRTGVDANTVRAIARRLSSAGPSVCYGRMGVSTQAFGGLCSWLINVINVLTGNLDSVGGALFPRPAIDVVRLLERMGQRGHFGRRRTRVRSLPEFGGEYPSSALAEEIDTPGVGQIRALVTSAGNPVLSTPNGARLDRALSTLDFMVSVDIYLNETTRHANVILPPTFGVEHDHYDLAFHALAIRNTAKYSEALVARSDQQRHDWEIFLGLAMRLREKESLPSRARMWAMERLLGSLKPHMVLDMLLRSGPYGIKRSLAHGLSLARLRQNPHGVDLGPLQPALPNRLYTKGKRIQLAPEEIIADVPRLASSLSFRREVDALELIGRRDLRSNNSWMHNAERLVKGPARCTLLMHPSDAASRGLSQGDLADVESRVGAVCVVVDISTDIAPGVVSLPHGWGHGKGGTQLRVATKHAGVSLNDLTDDKCVDELTGNAAFSGVLVRVKKTAAAPTTSVPESAGTPG